MQVTRPATQLLWAVCVCARVCVLRYKLDSSLSSLPTCFHSTALAVAQSFIAMEINHGYKHPAGHVQVRGSQRGVAGRRPPPPPHCKS